ncbi:MAG: Ig domain-containing protein [Pirellulales bacterium]
MQPREKKLAMIVGATVALVIVVVAVKKVIAAYGTRADAHAKLLDDKAAQSLQLRAGELAGEKLAAMENRSLSGNVEEARSRYQNWLLASLVGAGLEGVDVKSVPGGPSRRVYQPMLFNVTAKGNLTQLLTWLHDFYGTGHLHLVRRLNATPIEKSKQLDLDIGVEAISMYGAKGVETPPQMPERLPRGDLAAYRHVIESRNIAGPPNRAPTISPVSRVTGKLGQPIAFTVRGKDEDSLDSLTYRFEGDAPQDATLDPKSGKFAWTPPADGEPGAVTVKVTAQDDGLPPKSATASVAIAVERVGLKLASISDQKLDVGKAFSTTPRLLEYDAKRTTSFDLVGEPPEGLSFDEKTGAIKWTPTAATAGKSYRLSLVATDDAEPPNRDEKRFELSVLVPEVPKLELDFAAQRTYLTALFDVDGRPEAWFQVRPTGERITLSLPQGPDPQVVELRAGNFVGRLIEIDFDRDLVVIEASGRRLVLYRGKCLADAIAATSDGL